MLRSLMFVPARMRMLEKIPRFDADAYILDLEDSVPDADKETALREICEFLQRGVVRSPVYVRVDRRHASAQLQALRHHHITGFMIPKVESESDILEEIDSGKSVIALVETPQGIVNLERIAACGKVHAIAFGAEDYTACMGMKNSREMLTYPRGKILACAKAYSKPAYDTPCLFLNDDDAAESEIRYSSDSGFDGKLSIHPTHTTMINRIFKDADVDSIRFIIEAYESVGGGAVKINGRVYEKMHINHLKRILKEHR